MINTASIKERNGKFCVIYYYSDPMGKRIQKWETYKTKKEAEKRKKEIEYKSQMGGFVISQCIYLKDLLEEYVLLYGKEKWALSTYESNVGLIKNYILPIIGNTKISKINTRFIENYYKELQRTPSVKNASLKYTGDQQMVGTGTIRDIHKILRSCFRQAEKWELMANNPAENATVPKHKTVEEKIWTAEEFMRASECCDDEDLRLCLHIAFTETLRIGELAALTWDCVDISPEAIEEDRAYIFINKVFQRVKKDTLRELNSKDVVLVFPSEGQLCTTVRILKTPKTEKSTRKIFLPKSVAEMLIQYREQQDKYKEILGNEYHDYGLVFATPYGMPTGADTIRKHFKDLIKENDLPEVKFHSLRHTSITYKLKLSGGDIKAVQGDSGHSQVNMVTDVYSHILDEDRRKNATIFEKTFYKEKDPNPQMSGCSEGKTVTVPEGVDAELLIKVLGNPEMQALLIALAKGAS